MKEDILVGKQCLTEKLGCPENGSLRIGRISTKEREHSGWLKRRLFYYTTPLFSSVLALHKGPRLPDN
ncbi:hypothetical protein UQ42_27750 [Escherichia coli]|nr:hypothetical protein UQ42_27750 [Escherichia coli]